MTIQTKMNNPITIKLKKGDRIFLSCIPNEEDYLLEPGLFLKDEHYGFTIILDYNNQQKEFVYPTQCKIVALGIDNGKLKIYEEHKRSRWVFDAKTGKLEDNPLNDFTIEGMNILLEEQAQSYDKPVFIDPIKIESFPNEPTKSVITLSSDEKIEKISLHPGLLLGAPHYGFELVFKTNKETKQITIPTENRVVGIAEEDLFGEVKIYEDGKYHPWTFDSDGNLLEEAHYNEYSRRDQEYLAEKVRKSK